MCPVGVRLRPRKARDCSACFAHASTPHAHPGGVRLRPRLRDGDTKSHTGYTAAPGQRQVVNAAPPCSADIHGGGMGNGQDDGSLAGQGRAQWATSHVAEASHRAAPPRPASFLHIRCALLRAAPALGWPQGLSLKPRPGSVSSGRSQHSPKIKEQPPYQTRSS